MDVIASNPARDTIPRVTHVSYFYSAIQGIATGLRFDDLRVRLRQLGNELSRRSGGTASTARISDSYTFWSPTADAIYELMRLGLVERRPLPSKRINVDAHRDTSYLLTPAGEAIIEKPKDSESLFRGALTPLLINQHPYLSTLCKILAEEPLLIPEYTEEELREFKQRGESWSRELGEDAASRMKSSMKLATVSSESVTTKIRDSLAKRFSGGAEPTAKDILDTVADALVVATLEARGVRYDAITFNILMSWGRQLFIFDESRYVHEMPGRTIWSSADIEGLDGDARVSRRGLSKYGDQVGEHLAIAYREIADAIPTDAGGPGALYPYLEIFRVRALSAFRLRVNVSLVDRVIAEIADRTRSVHYRLELQLGMSNWPSSEAPFRLGSRRYYVILIKPEGDE